MNCTKCGAEVPSQSRFCPSCGQAVGAQAAPAPSSNKRVGVYAVISALVVVAALGAWYLRGRGVTQATQVPNPPQSPVVNAPATPSSPQANVLQSEANKQPLNLDSAQKPPPPADVVAYLEHLKKVDAARQDLQQSEIGMLLGVAAKASRDKYEKMFKMTDPDVKVEDLETPVEAKKATDRLNQDWQRLCQQFLALPAPEACASLAGKYYDALRATIAAYQGINQKLANMDVEGLYSMQGKSGNIDDKLDASDQELTNVCTRFGIQKAFTIKSDRGGGGGVLQFPGL